MSRKLNVIQVTGSDIGGGAETVVRQHQEELIRLGHEVQLLVGRKVGDDEFTTEIPFRRGPKGILRTARWLQRSTGLQNLYSPSFRSIEDSFAFVPDVLHLHSLHGVDSFSELSVVRRLSRKYPTIISMHDLWLMTGHCGHPLTCQKWKTGCGNCPDLTLYPAISRDATRINFRRKRWDLEKSQLRLIVPSQWLMDQVRLSPIMGHFPVSVVGNPVDTNTFSVNDREEIRRRHGIDTDDNVVIMVAQHLKNPFKGIEDGIATLNLLSAPRLKVVLVGNSADEVSTRLNAPTVVLPFTKSQAELASYYRMADLLLMPSRGETFGLVAAESMACGTPVVAFDVGGLPEVVGDDASGITIANRCVATMANEMGDLLGNRDRLQRMSLTAAKRIRDRFTLATHSERTIEVYRESISSFSS